MPKKSPGAGEGEDAGTGGKDGEEDGEGARDREGDGKPETKDGGANG